MPKLIFNKIYVIQSLDKNEEQTGKLIYDEVIKVRTKYSDKCDAEFILVNNRHDLENSLIKINEDCLNGVKPIIHLEIHGNENGDGLTLENNEYIGYSELCNSLTKININSGNNLFLTLAVCHGAWIMQNIKLDKPAPFVGVIGSFEKIGNIDLYIRYSEFYSEFLINFDFDKSFDILQKVNKKIPNTYRVLDSVELFKNVYKNYLQENTSEEGIKKRLSQIYYEKEHFEKIKLLINSKLKKFFFEIAFKIYIQRTRQEYFRKHSEIFFMIDKYPNNRERFEVPYTYKELFKI